MNRDLGFYTIEPDQVGVVRSALLFVFIPLFNYVIYPILYRVGIRRPLQKMLFGAILNAISFVLASAVQFKIDASPLNSVHVLWQLPQNLASIIADVCFHIIGKRKCHTIYNGFMKILN